MKRIVLGTGVLLGLSACAQGLTSGGFLRELPDEVLQAAAPDQNLNAVKLLEEDGCYWYERENVVETALVPLRSKSGRPICTRPQS